MDDSTPSQESAIRFTVRSPSSPGSVKKHHAGSLPLYMFLDERNVHAECPNKSNPYHKCTGACIQRMNGGTRRVSSAPSRESAENSPARSPGRVPLAMFVSSDGRNLHPKCPNASNPYHKCTERCVERMNEGKKPRKGETSSVLSTPSRGSRENSQMSSPRFSPDTEDNIAVNSPARSPISPRAARSVHPKCLNAQNPYHKCTERCMQRLNGEKKGRKGDASVNDREEKNISSNMRKNVHPQCPNASNPFHTTCTETCMQRISNMGKKQTEAKVSVNDREEKNTSSDMKRNVHPKCPNASNPYHTTSTESCMQRISNMGKKQIEEKVSVVIVSSKEGEKIDDIDASTPCMENFHITTNVHPQCKYASNPYHNCTETCIQRINAGKKKIEREISARIEGITNGNNMNKETSDVKPKRLVASAPNSLSSSRKSFNRMNAGKKWSEEGESGSVKAIQVKEEENTEEEKGHNEGNSDESERIMVMLEKSYSSCTGASDSSYKCAVDDSLCEENYVCINASNLHNNCAVDNLQIEKDQCEGEKRPNPYLAYAGFCSGKFDPSDQIKGGVSAVQAAENYLVKLDIWTYFLLYLAIIMSVLIAAGSK